MKKTFNLLCIGILSVLLVLFFAPTIPDMVGLDGGIAIAKGKGGGKGHHDRGRGSKGKGKGHGYGYGHDDPENDEPDTPDPDNRDPEDRAPASVSGDSDPQFGFESPCTFMEWWNNGFECPTK